MANTGNTQQQINYGASANDGQGDPLRTAFIKTDDNFDNVWLAGPVGSNITIGNNTIQSNNTNGNIILKPNGTGIVQANASIIPNADNTRDLGSSTQAWRRAYIDELLPDSLTVSGDAVIGGNLTVEGDTIQIGNITTDTLTIQLANTAANAASANGAGITVGANDDIATILYNSTANRWNVSVGMSAVGNISAPYFSGNGSLLTGVASYGNANVAANLAAFSNNPISTTGTVGTGSLSVTGNIVANAAGNLWNWVNDAMSFPSGASWTSNRFSLDEYITSAVDGYLNLQTFDNTSNVATELHMEHGIVQFNIYNGTLKTWEFNENGSTTFPGDVFPSANLGGSLGNSSLYWSNLWVANNTIYIGGVPLGMTAGNVLTVNGNAVLSNNSNTAVTTTGNITAGNVLTGGRVSATGNVTGGNILTGGLISATGNVTANYFLGNIEGLNGNISGLTATNFDVVNISARDSSGVNIGAGGYNNLVVLPTEVLIQNVPLTVAGNLVANQANGLYITANAPANGTAQIWNFGTDGRLTFPGTPRIDTDSNNFEVQAAESISLEANAVVNIYTDTSGTTYQWQFGNDGNLTLPTGKSIIVDGGDGMIGPVSDDMVISWDNEELILRSVAGSVQVEGDNDFNIQVDYNSGAGDYLSKWAFAQDNEIVNITGNSAIVTEAGNLNLQGGRNTINSGNVTITAINTGVAVNVWTFDNTGNLTVPGNIVMPPFSSLVGDGASPAPSISGFSSATFGANVTATGNISGGNLITTGNVSGNTAGFAIGYRDIPQVGFTGNATIATTDAGKHFYSTQSTDYVLTIANNASQGFQTGAAITVVNQGTGNITLAQGSGVTLYLTGNATSGNRTVTTFGMATLIKVATDTWFVSGAGVI